MGIKEAKKEAHRYWSMKESNPVVTFGELLSILRALTEQEGSHTGPADTSPGQIVPQEERHGDVCLNCGQLIKHRGLCGYCKKEPAVSEAMSEAKRCEWCGAEEGGYHRPGCISLPISEDRKFSEIKTLVNAILQECISDKAKRVACSTVYQVADEKGNEWWQVWIDEADSQALANYVSTKLKERGFDQVEVHTEW